MTYWTTWKKTYLRRVGFGFFSTLLFTYFNLINGVFEGAMIMLTITILLYVTDIPKLQRSDESGDKNE